MKRIESPENPVWKQLHKLETRKGREKEGLYLIEGFHLLLEAIASAQEIKFGVFRESLLEEEPTAQALAKTLEEKGAMVILAPDDLFDRFADTETPQGVLAAVKKPVVSEKSFFENPNRGGTNLIVLDRLQDPGNVGTILRTADAGGFLGALVIKGSADIFNPKVIRAASGSLFRLPVLFCESAEQALDTLSRHGKKIVVTAPTASADCYECPIGSHSAIVIGNEGGGVSDLLMQQADLQLKIPMESSVESLNAAVAAGILIFEAVRQQKYPIDGGK